MDLIRKVARSRNKPKVVEIRNVDGLTPERIAQLEAEVVEVRMNGRPQGAYLDTIRRQLLEAGRMAPVVIEDRKTETTTVPASFEGLVAHIASWDSLLLDEELRSVVNVVHNMVPMGLDLQPEVRRQREEIKANLEHMKDAHPETYAEQMGGIPV